MNNITKRFLLFIFGCLLTRVFFVVIAKNINLKYLPFLGYLALIPVIGWLYIILNNSRKIGVETFGEKIWWNNFRYIHLTLYLLFAILAIKKNNKSWLILLVDVIIGLLAFVLFHYQEGSFKFLQI